MILRSLTIRVDFEADAALRSAIASVPERFRLVQDESADVLVVHGGDKKLVNNVRRSTKHARLIIVTDPGLAETTDLEALSANSAVPIIAASAFYSHPAIRENALVFRSSLVGGVIDSVGTVHPEVTAPNALIAMLTEQLLILDKVVRGAALRTHVSNQNMFVVGGVTRTGTAVNLVGVRSGPATQSIQIDIVSNERRSHFSVSDPSVAQPARMQLADEAGTIALNTRHETALRSVLARAWKMLEEGRKPSLTLDTYVGFHRRAAGLLQSSSPIFDTEDGTN